MRGGERDRRRPLNAFDEANRKQQTHSPARVFEKATLIKPITGDISSSMDIVIDR